MAVNLALRTVAPELELIYEAGAYGAQPARLPLSIGDPTIVTGALSVMSQADLFGFYLQRGLVDVGFLGAAQIDRFGNINSTVIGDYATPTVRLPGSGGANEIALHSRKVFVVMRQSRRSFVERIDFCTSPGNTASWAARTVGGRHRPGRLPLRCRRRDAPRHAAPGRHARRRAGRHRLAGAAYLVRWPRRPRPRAEELRLIREVLDPEGRYTS